MLSNKICILFDTNMLECRFDDKCLNLSQPKFKNEYYAIEKFIIKNNLQNRVKICISEISILELKKHLKSCFKSQSDSLNDKIKHFKKIFGDLIDFQIDKEYSSEKEYSKYIEEYFKNLFSEKKDYVSIIPYPRDQETMNRLVNKAIMSKPPFCETQGKNKNYTDAGFKDALIYETLEQYMDCNFGILVSNDKDFINIFASDSAPKNIKLIKNEQEIIKTIYEQLQIDTSDENAEYCFIRDFTINEYLINTLLNEVGLGEESNFIFDKILELTKQEDSQLLAKFVATINGTKYIFEIIYEPNANEIVEILNYGEYNEE